MSERITPRETEHSIRRTLTRIVLFLLAVLVTACENSFAADDQPLVRPTYGVTYVAVDADGGHVPIDGNAYEEGAPVTVLGNTRELFRDGHTFNGWRQTPDGSGALYAGGDTLTMPDSDVELYAQWSANPTYGVTYVAPDADGGQVPVDGNAYEEGAPVTVLGNTGELFRDGHTFIGWRQTPDGSGTLYAGGDAFTMPGDDVELYAQWQEESAPVETPRIILDTDYGPDVDDLVAHAVLHGLADLGEVEIIAAIVAISNEQSPGAMNAVDTWHGRPDIPVGGFRGTIAHTGGPLFPNGGGGGESDGDAWAVSIYNAVDVYPRTLHDFSYPDALEVYRQSLRDAPDGSVSIVTIGMLNTLAELMNSPGDAIDSRSGMQLIADKVEAVYVMGGRNSGAEFNLRFAREEAADVADNLPVPIYWSQAEIGGSVFTGKWSEPLQPGEPEPEHIVRFGMEEFNFVPGSDGNGRQSWDAMNVLVAVRGEEAGFAFERGTMSVNPDDGSNSWAPSADGPHFRVSKTMSDAHYESVLEPLVFSPMVED